LDGSFAASSLLRNSACRPAPLASDHSSAFRAHFVRPNRLCRFVESSLLTAGVLPAALRAAARFKIAPGDFVDHSGTSPLSGGEILGSKPGKVKREIPSVRCDNRANDRE